MGKGDDGTDGVTGAALPGCDYRLCMQKFGWFWAVLFCVVAAQLLQRLPHVFRTLLQKVVCLGKGMRLCPCLHFTSRGWS